MSYLDVPKFKVHPRPERFLVDKFLILLLLGVLLYIGVYVNYFINNQYIPEFLNWIFIAGIIIILIIDALLCYLSYGHYSYEFHDDRMIISDGHVRTIDYDTIKGVSYSHNIIDNMLKTGSIVLRMESGKNVRLKYLVDSNQLYFWLQKHTG